MITFHNLVNKLQVAHKSFTCTMAVTAASTLNTQVVQKLLWYLDPQRYDIMFLQICANRSEDKASYVVWPWSSNHWYKSSDEVRTNIQGYVFNSICFRIIETTSAAMYVTCTTYKTSSKRVKTMRNVWQGLCNTPHWPYTRSTYLRHTRDTSCKQLTWDTSADYITNTYRVQNVILGGFCSNN